MEKVIVYTMNHCPFCERAKNLLNERGVPYSEVRVSMDDDAQWDALEKKTGLKTMPQILHGEKVIGGFSDLAALDLKDRLVNLRS